MYLACVLLPGMLTLDHFMYRNVMDLIKIIAINCFCFQQKYLQAPCGTVRELLSYRKQEMMDTKIQVEVLPRQEEEIFIHLRQE